MGTSFNQNVNGAALQASAARGPALAYLNISNIMSIRLLASQILVLRLLLLLLQPHLFPAAVVPAWAS
jgi:hypothetical protein